MAYETEEEQIEAIKRWWQENGRAVIAGVVVAVLGFVGWHQWQSYQRSQSLAAAEAYQEVLSALNNDDLPTAREKASRLNAEHGGSVQAVIAGLRLGGVHAERGDYEAAEEALVRARDAASNKALERLATLRVAVARDAQGKQDAALELLEPAPDGEYAVRYNELIGDIRASRDEREAAVEAYRAAIDAGARARRRGLIQLKLADLGAGTGSSS